jgi:hypothetical protein
MLPLLSLLTVGHSGDFSISRTRTSKLGGCGRRATLNDKVIQQFQVAVDIATSLQIGGAILFSIWIRLLHSQIQIRNVQVFGLTP